VLIGRCSGDSGILDVARQVKQRVKAFGYVYRMTNDTHWVDRTWEELQVGQFMLLQMHIFLLARIECRWKWNLNVGSGRRPLEFSPFFGYRRYEKKPLRYGRSCLGTPQNCPQPMGLRMTGYMICGPITSGK
jgi:hypothetical protein